MDNKMDYIGDFEVESGSVTARSDGKLYSKSVWRLDNEEIDLKSLLCPVTPSVQPEDEEIPI